MPADRIPFTVIGGYLGAGKTTLLNHILRHNKGRRFALLINDFGSINIDAEMIENRAGDTINLANGCVCCTLAAGFLVAIKTVLERDPPPDHIIVEASGVADPHKIAQYGHTRQLYLDGVLVVADAETVQAKARDKYVGPTVLRQLRSADLIILNKIDLVTERQRQAARDWLAETAPDSRVVEAQYGIVPLQFLFGIETAREVTATPENDDDDHVPHVEYETWSYTNDSPISRHMFGEYVSRLPQTVIRAKGFVYLEDDPDRRMVFQLVGKRWTLKAGESWGERQPGTRIVVIALHDRPKAGREESSGLS